VIAMTNALEAIRKIEIEAEDIIKDANKKAELTKKKTLEEGDKVKKQLIDDAQKKAADYRKKKDKETEKESNEILNNAKQEIDELKGKSSSQIPLAVDAMVSIAIGEQK
jgi:vacuolar-type H+-ATPase subunit H